MQSNATAVVLTDVNAERKRQVEKWGEQHHPDLYLAPPNNREYFAAQANSWKRLNDAAAAGKTLAPLDWTGILLEEVFEALAEGDPSALRTELVQVAAVAVAWIEDIDSRN